MLKIRPEQQTILLEAKRKRFVTRLIAHLRRHWTEDVAAMDDAALGEYVVQERVKAEDYGISIEADVVKYVEVSCLLGPSFDNDSAYPWAKTILRHPDWRGRVKAQLLRERAVITLQQQGS
tara:strand:+ start:1906 stop:2268 length:363 start_codon:yes stop_codon:yes gene_type:complete